MKEATSWRFSLRELLLATTTVAALVALAVKSIPSQPTPFFAQFDAQTELQRLLKEQGVKSIPGGSGSSASWGPGRGRKSWDVAWQQEESRLPQIRSAFANRVKTELKRCGCTIVGDGESSNGFAYSYERGRTTGDVVAEFEELPEGNCRLYAFCLEIAKR